ncbi:MAG: zinc ribbon domain-containing protein [Chloroflexi bacterium]|nr:zinc ribbon domain-containing protein [Chloroflexota bacterium]
MSDFFICPHCGAEVDYDAPACPECGSDDETGWSEDTAYDGLYLDDDEPLPESGWFSTGSKTVVTGLAIIIVVALLMGMVPGGFYWLPVLLLAIGLVYYATTVYAPNTRPAVEKLLYANLLTKARGDAAMVERWIGYERRFSPEADRVELMEDAIRRWERDNR